jgi:hypothetical protein
MASTSGAPGDAGWRDSSSVWWRDHIAHVVVAADDEDP